MEPKILYLVTKREAKEMGFNVVTVFQAINNGYEPYGQKSRRRPGKSRGRVRTKTNGTLQGPRLGRPIRGQYSGHVTRLDQSESPRSEQVVIVEEDDQAWVDNLPNVTKGRGKQILLRQKLRIFEDFFDFYVEGLTESGAFFKVRKRL